MSVNYTSLNSSWEFCAPYVAPPVAAGVAIIPVFYGFVAKSALQVGEPIPRMTIINALKGGVKAAPTLGLIVGTQVTVQKVIENFLKKNEKEQSPHFSTMLLSSVIVGVISAPALAAFNGQTMGKTVRDSLRELTAKQASFIVIRETSFLLSLRVSKPVSEALKEKLGDNKMTSYASSFLVGATGSIVGHPFDTALSLEQRKMKLISYRHLTRGMGVKAVATGGFACLYQLVQDCITSKK